MSAGVGQAPQASEPRLGVDYLALRRGGLEGGLDARPDATAGSAKQPRSIHCASRVLTWALAAPADAGGLRHTDHAPT